MKYITAMKFSFMAFTMAFISAFIRASFRAFTMASFRAFIFGRFIPALLLAMLFFVAVAPSNAQPYLYRADGVRGRQLFSDLSFLLGLEVRDSGSGLGRRTLVGEFRGDSRRLFLTDLARAATFSWSMNKSILTLSSPSRLLTRSYSFSSDDEYLSFRSRLRAVGIDAAPLIIRQMRGASGASDGEASGASGTNGASGGEDSGGEDSGGRGSAVVYDIQAIEAFHENAESIYAELSGEDHNRLISPSNSVIYPVSGERFALMIFRLQYAWAEDTRTGAEDSGKVLPGVASLMAKVLSARYGGSAPRASSASASGGASLDRLLGSGLEKINELGILPKRDGAGSNLSSSGSASSGSASSPISRGSQTLPIGSGKALIFADPRQNAIVIYDDKDRYSYYQRLIGELDSRTRLVKIEAAIIDISKSRVRDLGIQWQGEYNGKQTSFGNLGEGAGAGALSFATGGFSLSNNAIVSNVNGLIARINLLESMGRGRIVSRPSILTLDNIEASLSSSEKFFVKVEAFQDSSLYPVEVSTTLRVTPHIIREGKQTRIKLLVFIKDGSIDQSGSGNVDGLPRVTTNYLTTQAEILETQALVIGGHIRSELSVRRRRVPLLGYIPILGLPFSHKTNERKELVRLYIIRPRLTLPSDEMSGDARALITDEDLLAYPKLLSKEREKALKAERKREAKARKRATKLATKAAKREAKRRAKEAKVNKFNNVNKESSEAVNNDVNRDVNNNE